ncbi:MAG TPA: UDP-N-acetylglucosamine 2-epimerase (non-hydrolyzing) [Terriglobales bacterium]|nr:UDP-N-acetylglucosamine 2-epimerase (non-hydrolyzing) [Terriglobales bacterium]
MHIFHVVGARPNFMKLAPVRAALTRVPRARQTVLHTGQHYDVNMSEVFFQQLGMPAPDLNLNVGSGTHARQTADIMTSIEPVIAGDRPDLVLVYGDVNSTVAASLVCAKLGVRIGHVEAGLRSHDRSMPEEINRLVTDQLSDILFTPSADADENLRQEGIPTEKIYCVGNVMIDTLSRLLPACSNHAVPDLPKQYALVTLHRPSNVDDLPWLDTLLQSLAHLSRDLAVIFPVHPRTRQRITESGLRENGDCRLRLMDPQPYLAFLALQRDATVVITDSGGIQEETSFLGVPCLTMRDNTERPITLTKGTNILVGRDIARMRCEVERILEGIKKASAPIPLWDGHAAERIADVVASLASH